LFFRKKKTFFSPKSAKIAEIIDDIIVPWFGLVHNYNTYFTLGEIARVKKQY
jgi:hypothetical protein